MSKFKRLRTLAEMIPFDASTICILSNFLGTMNGTISLAKQANAEGASAMQLTAEKSAQALNYLNSARYVLNHAGLVLSVGFVDIVVKTLNEKGSLDEIGNAYEQLKNAIQIELDNRFFFELAASKKELFQPAADAPIFGSEVQEQFPSVLYEIDEAAKCLALERFTATVFHLMRAMERTLVALRKYLELQDPTNLGNRNWGVILRDLRLEVERRTKLGTTAWRSHQDQHFFTDLIGSLAAVKLAWRDPTMHPERNYNQTEAEEVFAAVRTLMQKIASKMDQEGMPIGYSPMS